MVMDASNGHASTARAATAARQWTVASRPATSLAAWAGRATSTTRSPPAPAPFGFSDTSTTTASVATTCGSRRRPCVRCRRGQHVDHVSRADEIQQRGVGQMQRHDAGVGACGGFGQPRAEQPDVGEHLAAAGGAGQRRADDRRRRRIASRREPLRPNDFRAARSSAVSSTPGQVARGDDDVGAVAVRDRSAARRRRPARPVRPPRPGGRRRCGSSRAATRARSRLSTDGLSDSPMPPR